MQIKSELESNEQSQTAHQIDIVPYDRFVQKKMHKQVFIILENY